MRKRKPRNSQFQYEAFPQITYMVIIDVLNKYITKSLALGNVFLHPSPKGCKNCPYEGRLHCHGSYSRTVITCLQFFEIDIPRFICPKCGKTYSRLPCFLIPYYRYSYDFVLAALYYLFVLKLHACKTASLFRDINTECYISLQSVIFFKKRFLQNIYFINSFFSGFDGFYYSMDLSQLPLSLAGETIILKILKFELMESFNSIYFNLMSKHFLRK